LNSLQAWSDWLAETTSHFALKKEESKQKVVAFRDKGIRQNFFF